MADGSKKLVAWCTSRGLQVERWDNDYVFAIIPEEGMRRFELDQETVIVRENVRGSGVNEWVRCAAYPLRQLIRG